MKLYLDQLEQLDALGREEKKSRQLLVREAVAEMLERRSEAKRKTMTQPEDAEPNAG